MLCIYRIGTIFFPSSTTCHQSCVSSKWEWKLSSSPQCLFQSVQASTFPFTFLKHWASFCPFLITRTWLYLHLSLQPVHRFAHYACLPYHLKDLSMIVACFQKYFLLVIALYIFSCIKIRRREGPMATERVPIKCWGYSLVLMHQLKVIEVKLKFQDYLYALEPRNWEESM